MSGLLLAVAVGSFGTAAVAAERVALVIGNGLYRHVSTLPNPSNDARAISAALETVGFQVVAGYDLDADGMGEAIERFERALDGAKVALVYYAGHGISVDGVNYLLPVDAKLDTRSALKKEAFSADWLLGDVMEGEDRVSIVMLDACRNNPLTRSFSARTRGAVGAGLAEVRAKTGSYVAFATAPGDVASDGGGANSPFTTAVLRHLATPGLEIDRMMKLVRREVYTETGEDQLPWTNSALLGEFYFVPPAMEAAVSVAAGSAEPAVVATLPTGPEAAARAEPEVAAVDPRRPSPEELRLAALERVESALLRTPGARRQVQEELLALGHAPGRPDGRFGPGTRAAIGSFQAASALEVTGYADKPTLVALEREAARLAPPIEEAATVAQPRPSRLRPNAQAVAAPPQPPPVAAAAPPQAAGVPGGTMGTCTAAGGASWANERHLTYDQCRKVGGSFTPF